MSQRELAARLDTSQSVVARWENGTRSPTMETVTRALRACGFELGISISPHDDYDMILAERERRRSASARIERLRETLEFERRGAGVDGDMLDRFGERTGVKQGPAKTPPDPPAPRRRRTPL